MFEGTAVFLTYRGLRGDQHTAARVIQHDDQRVTNMSETIHLHLVRIGTTRSVVETIIARGCRQASHHLLWTRLIRSGAGNGIPCFSTG